MRFLLLFFLVLFVNLVDSLGSNSRSKVQTDIPVIGILTQSIYGKLKSYYSEYKSFIVASYVKFIEGAGARVVPIWTGRDERYYSRIINRTNGVLLPGGAQNLNEKNGYADAGKILYNLAMKINDRGDYYPIFGTCLGMELLVYISAGRKADESLINCSAYNVPMSLNFKKDFKNSKMFSSTTEEEIRLFSTKKVAANFHRKCVTQQTLKESGISDKWRVNSLSEDEKGVKFISTIEHKEYPFFGIQFHPEKSLYEWNEQKAIIHSYETAKTSQYLANFFVNQSRLNHHSYKDRKELQKYLIWNYFIDHTGRQPEVAYDQCYFFTK